MKEFSELEREILRFMLNDHEKREKQWGANYTGFHYIHVFQHFLEKINVALEIDFNKKEIIVCEEQANGVNDAFQLNKIIVISVRMFDYLLKNELIFGYLTHTISTEGNSKIVMISNRKGVIPIDPHEILKRKGVRKHRAFLLPDFYHEKIFDIDKETYLLSENLIFLIQNDFKTKEDIKHEQNLEIAKKGLLVAEKNATKAIIAAFIGVLGTLTAAAITILSELFSKL